MASNRKKKTRAKKKAQAAQTRAPLPVVSRKAFLDFAMGVCSITNPFCMEAIAARWPDESYTKSVGWSITGFPITLTSDAAGCGARLYFGDKDYQTNVPASIAAPTVTYNANNASLVTFPSGVARQRVTSWGIKIRCIAPALTASGTLRVRLFSPMGGATLASVSGTTTMADAIMDIPAGKLLTRDLHVIPAPLGITARTFQAPAIQQAIANWVNNGWQVIQVYFDGAPATTAMYEVAYYCNYELVFADGDSQYQFSTPPPANSLAKREVSQGVLEKIGNFVEGAADRVDKLFQSRAFQYAASAGLGYATGGASGVAAGLLTNGARARPLAITLD